MREQCIVDSCVPTPAMLVIDPAMQDLGVVLTNTSSTTLRLMVSNVGGTASEPLSVSVSGSSASELVVVSSTCSLPLAAGASCEVLVRFDVSAAGMKAASLEVRAGSSTASALLTALAVLPGALVIDPGAYDYGSRDLGGAETRTVLTARNTGGASVGPLTTALSGSADFRVVADSCTGVTLSSGVTCSVEVGFSPSSAGLSTATVTVASPSTSAVSSLRGTGTTPARLEIDPNETDFGFVALGHVSETAAFNIRNSGSREAGAPSVAIVGAGALQYEVVSNGCTAPLAGGGMCTVTVRYRPMAVGRAEATLRVGATPGGVVDGALHGEGVTTYRAEVLADSPLAYFPLDEAVGPVRDVVGGLVGTTMGTVTLGRAPLASGTAVDLGATGWIETPVASALGTSRFTIEVWARPAASPGTFRGAVSLRRGNGCGDTRGWSIAADMTDRWNVYTGTSGPLACWNETAGGLANVSVSHHLVLTYDGVTSVLYVDGAEVGRRTIDYRPIADSTLRLGFVHGDGDAPQFHFEGTLDELAIYDRALTPAAVARHFAAAL